MEQRELPLMGRLDGPSVVPFHYVQRCKTYREAVRESWRLRRVSYMTQAQLASEAEVPRQHVSDYINPDDKPGRRDLPPEAIRRWNGVVGNTLVSQWVAHQDRLTVLEQVQADQNARVAA